MKPIKYGKTPQFRDVIRIVKDSTYFEGLDNENNPIYDYTKELPKLTFTGTVKLHGTNASIRYNADKGIAYQSRNGVKQNGHFNFVEHMNQHDLMPIINSITKATNLDPSKVNIVIYGEWAGENIQNGVAISELPKCFYVFAIKITPCCNGPQFDSYYLRGFEDYINLDAYDNIEFIKDYKTWEYTIDFNNPEKAVEDLIDITNEVEEECPVASSKGVKGIGEGVVWECFTEGSRIIFKVKGEKHANSKVKKLNPVDVDAVNSAAEFADLHVVQNRILQAIKELEIENVGKRHTADIITWIKNDVLSEEHATIKERGLNIQYVVKELSNKTRTIFFQYLNGVQ